MSAQKSNKDEVYTICKNSIETYHYKIGKNLKQQKFTPYQTKIIETSKHEGLYHPICKINNLPNINITENEIVDGNTVIFNSKKPNIDRITPELHIAIITCQYHSVVKRFFYDMINKHGNVDSAHLQAALYTIKNLFINLQILQQNVNESVFKCVQQDLLKNFGNLNDISYVYSLKEPTERISEFNKLFKPKGSRQKKRLF
jgi:predicted DNA-binding transcriptional regulator